MRSQPSPSYEQESEDHYISMQTWRVNCLRSQAWADQQRLLAFKRFERRRWMSIVFICLFMVAIVAAVVAVVC